MPTIKVSQAQSQHDVAIVGAGAGGGQMAYTLSLAGLKCVMLEAGRSYDPASETPMVPIHRAMLTRKLDAETIPAKLHPANPRAQLLAADSIRVRAACFYANGRDRHPRGFTMRGAGGGARGGTVHGRTNDFSYNVVEDPFISGTCMRQFYTCSGLTTNASPIGPTGSISSSPAWSRQGWSRPSSASCH